jgi:hypothetical protein
MPRSASCESSNSRSRSSERGRAQPEKKGKKEKKDKKKKDRRTRGSGSPKSATDEETHGGSGAAGSTLGNVLALPTDNTVLTADFVNSMASSINDLTRTMKEVQIGMQSMQRASQEQRSQISVILSELQGMKVAIQTNNTRYETEMAALNDDIKAKIEKLQSTSARAATSTPSPSTAASSSSAASQAAPAASGGPLAPGARRPTRLWIKGFKEVLTSRFLVDFANAALARIPTDLRAGAKAGAPGFGAVVYIDFPANTVMKPIKDALIDLKLTHTDMEKTKHELRISFDQTLDARHKGRVLGELWKLVEPYLAALPAASRPTDYKLGNSSGKLFLVIGNRPVELFATSQDDQGNMTVTSNDANLAKYQVSDAMARAWSASAVRNAVRVRQ